jgi:hypothetical protein
MGLVGSGDRELAGEGGDRGGEEIGRLGGEWNFAIELDRATLGRFVLDLIDGRIDAGSKLSPSKSITEDMDNRHA